ncbi:hypothetical protein OG871_27115 [Kitasatospora sp. NBC_00374]|uniref:hypothetical protein n=1 Tax=Kitasatospora sp. NBC_00374 TaxID=2975964 RepID=UPI00324C8622
MLRDAVRGVVAVATTIAEETGKRVLTTATGLLERGGVDVAAVERRFAEQFPPSGRSLQSLAEEAVTVGRAGVDMAVGVARAEAEKVFERVGDQVVKIGVVLSFLESQLRNTEEEPAAAAGADQPPARPAARAEALFEAGWDDEEWGSRAETDAETVPADAWAVPEEEPEPDEKPAEPVTGPAARSTGPGKAPAKKAPAKKAPAAKRTAKAPTPREAMPKEAPAHPVEKPAAKKATGKKTVAKKTVARKTVAGGAEPTKPAGRKTAARKTVVRKTSAAKPEPEQGTDG